MNALCDLRDDEVHVWRIDLTVDEPGVRRLVRLLTPAERTERASGLARPEFIVARAAMRSILGRYLAILPAAVTFEYGPAGKPLLAAPQDRSGLVFNLGHSGNLALCAVARRRGIGVDLEQLRPGRRLTEIVDGLFTAAERRALQAVPPTAREVALLRGWTAKEAYVKAVGGNLLELLDQFTVSMDPAAPPRLVSHQRREEVKRWSMADIPPSASHVATLAVEGTGWGVQYRHWCSCLAALTRDT